MFCEMMFLGQESFRVKGIQYGKYDLPLRNRLTAGASSSRRQGLIVEVTLEADHGKLHMGCGEVAPLPGTSLASFFLSPKRTFCSFLPCSLPPCLVVFLLTEA